MTATPLPEESAKAFAAYKTYLEMGDKRSQERVSKKLSKSRQFLSRWAAKYKWKERVLAAQLDESSIGRSAEEKAAEQTALERARTLQARKTQVQETAWELFEELSKKAKALLKMPAVKSTATDETGRNIVVMPADSSYFTAAARLMQVGDSLGRMAADMPTTRQEITGKDGSPLPTAAGPTIVNVHVKRNSDSEAAVELFGASERS